MGLKPWTLHAVNEIDKEVRPESLCNNLMFLLLLFNLTLGQIRFHSGWCYPIYTNAKKHKLSNKMSCHLFSWTFTKLGLGSVFIIFSLLYIIISAFAFVCVRENKIQILIWNKQCQWKESPSVNTTALFMISLNK